MAARAGGGGSGSATARYTVAAIGDSLTANGYTANTYGYFTGGGVNNILFWAHTLSGGRLALPYPQPIYATGGFTSAQVLSTHLPSVVTASPKPGFCVVLAGRNDPATTSTDISTTKTNLTAIYTQLLAAGITPVCATLPPDNLLNAQGDLKVNAWIQRYARENGFPFVDFHSAMIEANSSGKYSGSTAPGTYNVDNVHLNAAGAKVAGQALWDALKYRINGSYPPFAYYELKNSQETTNEIIRPLFLTDTGSGVPYGWAAPTGSGVTTGLASDANITGNYFTLTRGSADANIGYNGSTISVTSGDRLLFCCRFKASVKSAGANWSVGLNYTDNTYATRIAGCTEDLPSGSGFCVEFAASQTSNLFLNLSVAGASTGSVSIGQATLLNLTTSNIV